MVCGRCAVDFFSMFAANILSAGVPCLSPRVSFLYANVTEMGRLHRNCPFIASMAASAASNES